MPDLGFIFDLDGTIVDTTAYYLEVWEELIHEFGANHDPEPYLARPTRENFRALIGEALDEAELETHVARQAELGREKMRTRGVRAHDGILELIGGLHGHGIKLALATSAERSNAEWALAALGISKYFNAVVADQDVARGKPAPDVYLEALARLGVEREHCAVMEDSSTGTRAGRAAGLRVIAVLTTHSRRALQEAGANRIVERASELTVEQVIRFIHRMDEGRTTKDR